MGSTQVGRTIISDSYAPFGTRVDLPDRPEPTEAEREAARAANEIEETALLRARGWAPADIVTLRERYGFPKPTIRSTAVLGSWVIKTRRTYRRADIEAWEAGIRRLLGGVR